MRVGVLEDPGAFPPDIHIFTETKQAWYRIAEGVPVVAEYYRREEYWPEESLQRWAVLRGA